MAQDEDHLRLLSLFHFVVAGVTGMFALFPVIHMFAGLAIILGALKGPQNEGVPPFFGWIFILFGGVAIVLGLAFAIVIVLAGRALRRHRHYTFCLVVASLLCVAVPFGTVLGVFTIVVLMRDSVKELFDRPALPASPVV